MAETIPFEIQYCKDLPDLSQLLLQVNRAGTFATSGELLCPLPGLSIKGIGRVAFPLLPVQAKQIAKVADQAPYGKGEKTLVDTKVRKVKQLAPDQFMISGKAWQESLAKILDQCNRGLGVDYAVELQLYKLLLYEKGSFFAPHRDTEKAKRMFGTLIISFPSLHEGGELIIRHQTGEEERIHLSPEDTSELRFAAFYADCEHEVTKITSGNRLCLVYNMVRKLEGKEKKSSADKDNQSVDYTDEITKATSILSGWRKRKDRSRKIAWLLEHDYTPENLSFSGLKLQDAGRAHVVARAAQSAGLSAHLGLVHISESGVAEVYGGYSRWDEEDSDSEEYELIEAYEFQKYIHDWVDLQDRPVNYGEIPLTDDELLPEGALKGEDPDEIRVTEATGNEGGSYERFYYRAALVIWAENETGSVLMQSGPQAVVPYFAKLVDQKTAVQNDNEISALAKSITTEWIVERNKFYRGPSTEETISIQEMLSALNRYGKPELSYHFLSRVACARFSNDSSDQINSALISLTQVRGKEIVKTLVSTNCSDSFVELSDWFQKAVEAKLPYNVLRAAADEMAARISKLATIKPKPKVPFKHRNNYYGTQKDEAKDTTERDRGEALGRWLVGITEIPNSRNLLIEIVETTASAKKRFLPDTVLFHSLQQLNDANLINLNSTNSDFSTELWIHISEFLLKRSSQPSAKPTDWKLRNQKLPCPCDYCRLVNNFAQDPTENKICIPLNKQRRQHLHNEINSAEIEMTHETERKGSPYTLVLKKQRWRHKARVKEYKQDKLLMQSLIDMKGRESCPEKITALIERLEVALDQ